MEEQIEHGIIQSVELGKSGTKKDGTQWFRVAYKINGLTYAKFWNDQSEVNKFKMGDLVKVMYTEDEKDGKTYRNIKSIIPTEDPVNGSEPVEEQIKVTNETISNEDPRRREIRLGQSLNLSLQHMHYQHDQLTTQEFDDNFKEQTRRFNRMIKELQEEIL